MTYKTMLAILQGEGDTRRVLNCAVPLASRFDAHLIGLHAEPLPVAYAAPAAFPDAALFVTGTEVSGERSAQLRQMFEERARAEGISFEWRGMESFSGDSALSSFDSARTSDLVIAQQQDPDAPFGSSADVESLIFESGRPVLFVPYATACNTSFERVLVAWNGSREACRAVFDAVPFIKEAKSTEVLTVDAPDDSRQSSAYAGAEIAASLTRHGAHVTTFSPPSGGISGAAIIENRVAETDADLLVMGAYSQSRLKEFFFGGATRTVLQSMTCAVLMSR